MMNARSTLSALFGTALLSSLALYAGPAFAQDAAANAKAKFDAVDTDHDGKLSLAEWKAAGRRERGFNIIDTNHDGFITPAELQAAMAKYGH